MTERHARPIAHLVLVLDAGVCACRAGRNTGLPSLRSDVYLRADIEANLKRCEGSRASLPEELDTIELGVLSALAQVYGETMVSHAALGDVLRLLAHEGGVVFLRRLVWGETDEDLRLVGMLTSARRAFLQLATLFAAPLLADANAALARFRQDQSRPGSTGRAQ